MNDDDRVCRARAMERDEDRRHRDRIERDEAESMRKALEPRHIAPATDAQQFSPMAELAAWRRWATGILGGDGFQGDDEQRGKLTGLERIAKAAIAFVDEQGKRLDGQYGLSSVDDFAASEFDDLVGAVKAAGR